MPPQPLLHARGMSRSEGLRPDACRAVKVKWLLEERLFCIKSEGADVVIHGRRGARFREECGSTRILSDVCWMSVLPSSVAVAEAGPVVQAGGQDSSNSSLRRAAGDLKLGSPHTPA